MHFLLVNDDGIGAKGIMAMLRAAVRRGHTATMCAPSTQQSAASHRFTMNDPLFVCEYPLDAEGCKGWSITGSPADCVRVGMNALVDRPVDMVISGINDGPNAGSAVFYSGTVGAAREGAFHHLPAMAVSIQLGATPEMLDHLADYTVGLAEQYASMQVPDGAVLNINGPRADVNEIKPAVWVPLDKACYTDHYERREKPRGGTYFWLKDGCYLEESTPGSDNDCLNQGHITLTLIGHYDILNPALRDSLKID